MPYPLSRSNRLMKTRRTQSAQHQDEFAFEPTQQTPNVNINNQYFVNSRLKGNVSMNPSQNNPDSNLLQTIEELKTQLRIKDKGILKLHQKMIRAKSVEYQLKQTYRVIHFYEGKINQLENVIADYEILIKRQNYNEDVNKLMIKFKQANIELTAQVSQLIFDTETLMKTSQRYQRKYENVKAKMEMSQRKIIETDKISMKDSEDRSHHDLKLSGKFYGSIYSRITKMQQDIQMVRSQNQKLQHELDLKLSQIKILQTQNRQLLQKITKNKQKHIPNVVIMPRSSLREITKLKKDQTEKQVSTRSSREHYQKDQGGQQLQTIMRKIKYHLIRSNYSNQKLNQTILEHPQKITQLTKYPFNLSIQEAEVLTRQMGNPKSASKLIPKYNNISISRDKFLNTQISNAFRNRVDEVEELIKKHGPQIPHSKMSQYLKSWGLSLEQLQFIGLRSYEETGQILFINFQKVSHYFLQN